MDSGLTQPRHPALAVWALAPVLKLATGANAQLANKINRQPSPPHRPTEKHASIVTHFVFCPAFANR